VDAFIEESKKAWVGKISLDVPDSLIERVLKVCGPIESWKRSTDGKGNLKGFGFCYYQDIQGVYYCYTLLNDYNICGSCLSIKLDKKTENHLKHWKSELKSTWLWRSKGQNINMDEIEDLESWSNLGEKVYPPWESEIIKEFNFKQIEELIGNKHLVSLFIFSMKTFRRE